MGYGLWAMGMDNESQREAEFLNLYPFTSYPLPVLYIKSIPYLLTN